MINLEKEELTTMPLLKYVILLGGALILGALLSRFIFQINLVSGNSMHPSLNDGEFGISLKAPYRLFGSDFNRNDVVTMQYPNEDRVFIKRVIGLPNEHIEIIAGDILINGKKYNDEYRNPFAAVEIMSGDGLVETTLDNLEEYRRIYSLNYGDYFDIQLGSDEYFCLGDNRFYSTDSRLLGPIKKKDIHGKFIKLF